MVHERRLLVLGARTGGLGAAVAHIANARPNIAVTTAGIEEEEDLNLDVTEEGDVRDFFKWFRGWFTDVVVTTGCNYPSSIAEFNREMFAYETEVNVVGPLAVLGHWLEGREPRRPEVHHFAVVSSNSAHIARRGSLGYCATKAALSMALRVAAREQAGGDLAIYGYEPGWLDGTPMSDAVLKRIGDAPPHRIPGGKGVKVEQLASKIVHDLTVGGTELNGTLQRIDGGEQ